MLSFRGEICTVYSTLTFSHHVPQLCVRGFACVIWKQMQESIAILSTDELEGEMHKWIFRILKVIFRLLSSMLKCQGYLKIAT